MSLIEAGRADELKDGTMQAVRVQGREILLARVGERYYAANNRCPHMGGNLSKGRLKGTVVTCPLHGSQFDLTDGTVVRWTNWSGMKVALAKAVKPPRPLKVYAARVEGDKIVAEV